ncbi:hypothetical protein BD311DRAFT_667451 [Dichomitus squalens]|uniref:DUF6533 domain-containing protein n=1 Tax=Dichomitus squalens TaxID=114155 RepID=A0A4Q9MGC7_9APHY|nr:hypothetical protein BD311DRAFT_667451 [Dichomitus squalens]
MAAMEAAQIITLVAESTISNYISLAITSLLAYEWVIGLGKEVNLFWREKVTGATVLFLLNRYAPLVYMLSSYSGSMAVTDKVAVESCNASVMTSFALDNLQYVPWALFSSLRVYALCGKRWVAAMPVLVFSVIPIGINLTHFYWSHGEYVPVWRCQTVVAVSPALSSILAIVNRSSLIIANAIDVVVTWYTTYNTAAIARCSGRNVPSIAQLLLVNGTIYFLVLLVLNILHLTFTVLSIAVNIQQTSYIVSFTEPITAILVSRFMFDLQKVKQRTQHHSDPFGDATVSAPGFNRVLGSIGSVLDSSDVWRVCSNLGSDTPEVAVTEYGVDVFGKHEVVVMLAPTVSRSSDVV